MASQANGSYWLAPSPAPIAAPPIPPRRRESQSSVAGATSASPPDAVPAPLPFWSDAAAASRPPPPAPIATLPWSGSTSFLLSGSSAPPIVSHRRPDTRHYAAHPSPPPPPPFQQGSPFAATPALAVLLTNATCCCCATALRYPRDSPNFRCTICGTITDLPQLQHRLDASPNQRPAALPSPTPATQYDGERFGAALRDNRSSLVNQVDALQINNDSGSILMSLVSSAFSNLESLELFFRQPSENPFRPSSRPSLPSLKTLDLFYTRVTSRPAALDLLRNKVEALLKRPGSALTAGNGSWLITLFECPVFLPAYTTNAARRNLMVAQLVGLISNLPNNLHHALVDHHLSSPEYPKELLLEKVELVVSFISTRIGAALASPHGPSYADDWAIKAAAKVGALLFVANSKVPRLPLSAFYCTLVDWLGHPSIIESFQVWESQHGRFTLCQYPFLLSLGVKILLLTFDGQRQMIEKAREALHATIYRRVLEVPFLILNVRRQNLVQDSLSQISRNRAQLKKKLKIGFEGEDGIDAGGLRKEWFLLLCRQLFDSQWGMFNYDEDSPSSLCYFNPASTDSDEFFLVGSVVGLAIYNSVTLDVPLPRAVYRKLMNEPISLADLVPIQPSLARGLQALLDYEGDVADTFMSTFVGSLEAYGEVREEPLIPGGEHIDVTNENREEYVRLLVDFILTKSVAAQFDQFARGFAQVTAGNSLSLFKGEELELLVRGSPEPLDLEQLKTATVYEGFPLGSEDSTVKLFWRVFASFSPSEARHLLSFITGTDRIPATGTGALTLKLTCMGDEIERYPQSHTCFKYPDEEVMRARLTTAMKESEGFDLK